VVRENAAVRYAAAVNLLMAYFKLKDGWRDERSFLSLLAFRILSPYIGRIRSAYPAVYEAVHEQLGRLALVEAENVSSVDAAAEPLQGCCLLCCQLHSRGNRAKGSRMDGI